MKILRFLFTLFFLMNLSGCDLTPKPSVRIAHMSWPGYELLTLAKTQDLYRHVDVSITRLSNSDDVMKAFKHGVVDVIATTLNEAIDIQSQEDEQFLIIAILDISHGGDVIISTKEIASLNDLNGKTVAMEPTAFGAFVVSRAMSLASISPNHLNILPVSLDKHYELFMEGKMDAVVTYEPAKSKILRKKGHIIFDSTQIPDEIFDVLVTRKDFANKHPMVLSNVVAGYFRALELLHSQRQSVIAEIAVWEGVSIEEYSNSLSGILIPDLKKNYRFLGGDNPELITSLAKLSSFLNKNNIVIKKHNLTLQVSDSYLPKQE